MPKLTKAEISRVASFIAKKSYAARLKRHGEQRMKVLLSKAGKKGGRVRAERAAERKALR
jgi:hypothetical protein